MTDDEQRELRDGILDLIRPHLEKAEAGEKVNISALVGVMRAITQAMAATVVVTALHAREPYAMCSTLLNGAGEIMSALCQELLDAQMQPPPTTH